MWLRVFAEDSRPTLGRLVDRMKGKENEEGETASISLEEILSSPSPWTSYPGFQHTLLNLKHTTFSLLMWTWRRHYFEGFLKENPLYLHVPSPFVLFYTKSYGQALSQSCISLYIWISCINSVFLVSTDQCNGSSQRLILWSAEKVYPYVLR